MSKLSFVVVLILAAGAVAVLPRTAAGQHSEEASEEASEEDVPAAERAWLDAYENSDPEAMRRIVADNFVITYPNGQQLNKEETVAFVDRDPETAPDSRMYTENDTVRFFGEDVAVITGLYVQEVTLADGTVRRGESLYTDMYRFMDGRWQVIASHLSKPPGSN